MSCYKVLQQSPSRSALQAESSSVCTQCARIWNRGPGSPLCPDRSASLPHKSVSPRGRKARLLSYLSSPTPTRRVTCRFKRRHICSCHVGAWPTPSADHSSLPSLLFLSTSSFSVPVSSSISLGLTDWLSVFFFLIYISVQDKMITLSLLFLLYPCGDTESGSGNCSSMKKSRKGVYMAKKEYRNQSDTVALQQKYSSSVINTTFQMFYMVVNTHIQTLNYWDVSTQHCLF